VRASLSSTIYAIYADDVPKKVCKVVFDATQSARKLAKAEAKLIKIAGGSSL